jgi:hypothetical protein
LLDCADREEAIAAQQCPAVRFATIEKRLGHRGATTAVLEILVLLVPVCYSRGFLGLAVISGFSSLAQSNAGSSAYG